MANETIALEKALAAHRAKLDTIEALAKTVTDQMQHLLTIRLQTFDHRLDTWVTAAPLHTTFAHYDAQVKQP